MRWRSSPGQGRRVGAKTPGTPTPHPSTRSGRDRNRDRRGRGGRRVLVRRRDRARHGLPRSDLRPRRPAERGARVRRRRAVPVSRGPARSGPRGGPGAVLPGVGRRRPPVGAGRWQRAVPGLPARRDRRDVRARAAVTARRRQLLGRADLRRGRPPRGRRPCGGRHAHGGATGAISHRARRRRRGDRDHRRSVARQPRHANRGAAVGKPVRAHVRLPALRFSATRGARPPRQVGRPRRAATT